MYLCSNCVCEKFVSVDDDSLPAWVCAFGCVSVWVWKSVILEWVRKMCGKLRLAFHDLWVFCMKPALTPRQMTTSMIYIWFWLQLKQHCFQVAAPENWGATCGCSLFGVCQFAGWFVITLIIIFMWLVVFVSFARNELCSHFAMVSAYL